MKQYRVGCNEIQYGDKVFEAESEDEAIKLANKYIEEHGMDDTFEVHTREYDAVYAEDVK